MPQEKATEPIFFRVRKTAKKNLNVKMAQSEIKLQEFGEHVVDKYVNDPKFREEVNQLAKEAR